jgi:hypothetical protein
MLEGIQSQMGHRRGGQICADDAEDPALFVKHVRIFW